MTLRRAKSKSPVSTCWLAGSFEPALENADRHPPQFSDLDRGDVTAVGGGIGAVAAQSEIALAGLRDAEGDFLGYRQQVLAAPAVLAGLADGHGCLPWDQKNNSDNNFAGKSPCPSIILCILPAIS